LKRSKRVKKYVHLFHSPTDIAFYEKYAFDWYDCLLTVGPFQEAGIRELERKRGTPIKELLPTGCTYFDFMRAEVSRLTTQDGAPSVLYAPAWGVRSSVLTYGSGVIDSLVSRGIKVIFRPHPQFYISHVELIRDIEKRLARSTLVEIDRGRTALASMARSDVLITDLSGILFDYACLFARPILLANHDVDPGGQEGEDMTGALWDVTASKDLSYALVDRLDALPELVARARQAAGELGQRVLEFRDRSFYNFGQAGSAAARNILSVFRSAS
jgi:CDP-glycerol glycerophosphotransferase (TagB/SpsB family)